MRIVTWNCQMGLDKKLETLLSLNADIAVVPECSEKTAIALRSRGFQTLWFGANRNKGLAVIARNEWPIHEIHPPEQQWIVSIAVDAPIPFTLIAVWACQVGTKKADNYIGQVYKAVISHPEWFMGRPIVIAGDLNSNKIWDAERRVGNHSEVVRILRGHGLVSSYHEHFKELHGEESQPTIHLYRHEGRPFHIDYIFIPREWAPRLKSVVVGKYAQWSKLSDHLPVIVELADFRTEPGSPADTANRL